MTGWRDDALCAQIGDYLFFTSTRDTNTIAEARSVCGSCDVRTECLTDALHAPVNPDGVWGGTTKPERARIRAAMKGTP